MSVFRNYNPQQSGGVNANAFPRVHPIPWTPTQRNVRSNPNIPSQPQRVQPHERGTFFPTSASGGGTLAPQMSSGCGCSGGGCNGSAQADIPTAVDNATSHMLPSRASESVKAVIPPKSQLIATPRVQSRMTGAIRAVPAVGTVRNSPRRVSLSAGTYNGRRAGL